MQLGLSQESKEKAEVGSALYLVFSGFFPMLEKGRVEISNEHAKSPQTESYSVTVQLELEN